MKKETKSNIRLNKFISNSGVCTRREADELIKKGEIRVNGKVVNSMGVTVTPGVDKVEYSGNILGGDVVKYVLLNKSKGYGIGGRDVSRLLTGASSDRLFPIGQLTTEETGLVLFSNDPDLGKKVKESNDPALFLYHVILSEAVEDSIGEELKKSAQNAKSSVTIGNAILLADKGSREMGISTNCSDTRVIRALLKSIGGHVVKMDRVIFAGITKKDIPRGKWRVLAQKEKAFLKML
jgi:23S rRNA pseudouridine2605 synthase